LVARRACATGSAGTPAPRRTRRRHALAIAPQFYWARLPPSRRFVAAA